MNEGVPKPKKVSLEQLPVAGVEMPEEEIFLEVTPDEIVAEIRETLKDSEGAVSDKQADMIVETLKETGGVLRKLANLPKSVRQSVLTTFGALALLVASPRWSESAEKIGGGTRIEEVAKNLTEADYTKAWEVLKTHGVKRLSDAERTEKLGEAIAPGSRALNIDGAATEVAKRLASECTVAGGAVFTRMEKIKMNYDLPETAPDFESVVAVLREKLKSANAFEETFKVFSHRGSVFGTRLDLALEWLRAAEVKIAEWKDPKNKEMLEKKSAAKRIFDRLEQKERKEVYLSGKEIELKEESLRVLKGQPSQLPEKQSGSEIPQKPSGSVLDEVPAQLKRAGEELKKSTGEINRLMEEMRGLNKK